MRDCELHAADDATIRGFGYGDELLANGVSGQELANSFVGEGLGGPNDVVRDQPCNR